MLEPTSVKANGYIALPATKPFIAKTASIGAKVLCMETSYDETGTTHLSLKNKKLYGKNYFAVQLFKFCRTAKFHPTFSQNLLLFQRLVHKIPNGLRTKLTIVAIHHRHPVTLVFI